MKLFIPRVKHVWVYTCVFHLLRFEIIAMIQFFCLLPTISSWQITTNEWTVHYVPSQWSERTKYLSSYRLEGSKAGDGQDPRKTRRNEEKSRRRGWTRRNEYKRREQPRSVEVAVHHSFKIWRRRRSIEIHFTLWETGTSKSSEISKRASFGLSLNSGTAFCLPVRQSADRRLFVRAGMNGPGDRSGKWKAATKDCCSGPPQESRC